MARCKMYPPEKDKYHGFDDKRHFFQMAAKNKKIINYSHTLKE